MKKIALIALIICFTLGGTLSTNAAETRSATCANPSCPGFLRTKTIDEPQSDFSVSCNLHEGCTITCKNVVARIVITYCSVCNTEYKRGIQAITSTELHSKPEVILP